MDQGSRLPGSPSLTAFPPSTTTDWETEDHHTVFAFGNSEVYAAVQGEGEGRGGYNSAGLSRGED